MPSPHIEANQEWQARRLHAIWQWQQGDISTDVFRATLHRLGYRGQELAAEVALYGPQKHHDSKMGTYLNAQFAK